ncbi:PREDICTED: alanyl-tRNA editing protein Aarsd1 [Chinchilla lanigera]|uniref:alanyl-tRNA editing protein Aarsd1 n=1 Tax=Chinchilla lanigera TaxID=34839 RepID=UPI000696D965|nr:PREDICTED: alanyl-tRNA editing protein Aarsd1 [Chinchilla lanigera]
MEVSPEAQARGAEGVNGGERLPVEDSSPSWAGAAQPRGDRGAAAVSAAWTEARAAARARARARAEPGDEPNAAGARVRVRELSPGAEAGRRQCPLQARPGPAGGSRRPARVPVRADMVGGTQPSSLGDLQVIKILGTEKGKKNKTNLLFLAGQRVLQWVQRSHATEKALTALLKCGAEDHVQAVTKLQSCVKLLQKVTGPGAERAGPGPEQSLPPRPLPKQMFSLPGVGRGQ